MIQVIVAGLPGSGTTWLTKVIGLHPDVERAYQITFPHGTSSRGVIYPELRDLTQPLLRGARTDARLLVIIRDITCSLLSQKSRGFHKLVDWPTTDQNQHSKVMFQQIATWHSDPLFVSYEACCQLGKPMLEWVVRQIGLDTDRHPWSEVHAHDGNAKYWSIT